jgi:hypothetical protein
MSSDVKRIAELLKFCEAGVAQSVPKLTHRLGDQELESWGSQQISLFWDSSNSIFNGYRGFSFVEEGLRRAVDA